MEGITDRRRTVARCECIGCVMCTGTCIRPSRVVLKRLQKMLEDKSYRLRFTLLCNECAAFGEEGNA